MPEVFEATDLCETEADPWEVWLAVWIDRDETTFKKLVFMFSLGYTLTSHWELVKRHTRGYFIRLALGPTKPSWNLTRPRAFHSFG